MVGDNKILTVSYGTFSCTLEGFDDPFSTMKAIAEYFRDLAAEDRFFGAEPPQPDADMLHRIAEQTVQSRVAAEVTDANSLVLRQDHSNAIAPAAAAVMQPVADPEPTPMPAVDPAPVAEPVAPSAMEGDSIAAKLQRIRSVVAQETQVAAVPESFYSEDEHAEADTPATTEDTVIAAPEDVEMASDEALESADLEGMGSEAEAENETQDIEAVEAEGHADEAAETVAEDETLPEETAAESDEVKSDDASDFDADLDEDTIAGALEALNEAETEGDEVTENIFEEAAPRRRIAVQKISRAEVEAAQNGEPAPVESSDLSEEAEAALLRELADVEADIEDATSDTEAAEAFSAEEEASVEDASVEDAVAETVSEDAAAETLEDTSVEAVEELAQSEAEELSEDTAIEDAEIASDEDETEKEEARAERKARRSLLLETEDAALNRLMDATRSKMSDDDEGAVRRASIAHLKAAVAATKADDSIVQAAAKEEERELHQYRDDLARVVRPVRSRAMENPDGGEARPSTLMLVSEQRIEKPAEDLASGPDPDVRPRRVATAGNLALNEQFEEDEDNALQTGAAESFTEFAQRYQAMELPDLLEAAAAHYTYKEKVAEFTRPMLMRKISTLSSGDVPSREEGLRCFGALLRDNKIIRSGNGKFTLSETTRFASEARSDAG